MNDEEEYNIEKEKEDYAKEYVITSCPCCKQEIYVFELIDNGCMTCCRFDGELLERIQTLVAEKNWLNKRLTEVSKELRLIEVSA